MKRNKRQINTFETIFEEQKNGGYTVIVPMLPGCISEGDSFEEAKNNIAEAITAYLESLKKDHRKIPQKSPAVFIGRIAALKPVF